VTKVDHSRNEATVRFGNYTATVTSADMGWGKPFADTDSNPAIWLIRNQGVRQEGPPSKSRAESDSAVQGAMMTLNAKTGEVVNDDRRYDFLTNKFNNAFQAYRQTARPSSPSSTARAVEWARRPIQPSAARPSTINAAAAHYNGSTSNGDLAIETALRNR